MTSLTSECLATLLTVSSTLRVVHGERVRLEHDEVLLAEGVLEIPVQRLRSALRFGAVDAERWPGQVGMEVR